MKKCKIHVSFETVHTHTHTHTGSLVKKRGEDNV